MKSGATMPMSFLSSCYLGTGSDAPMRILAGLFFVLVSAAAAGADEAPSMRLSSAHPMTIARESVSSLSELANRIEDVRVELIERMDDSDRRYSQRFDAQQSGLLAALNSAKEAFSKFEDDVTKRFEGVNEFRATLADQATKFITRDTVDARTNGFDQALKAAVVERNNLIASLQKQDDGIAIRLSVLESSGSPTAIANSKDIQSLENRVASIENRAAGSNGTIEIEIIVIGLILTGIATWAAFRRPSTARR